MVSLIHESSPAGTVVMSFDPNETNVMPWTSNEFPITDELPAVTVRRRGTPPWLTAALLVGLLVAAGIVLVVAVVLQNRSEQSGSTVPTVQAVEATVAPLPDAPTAVVTNPGEPGFWQIVGVDDGLNVRSGPGTNNDVVGVLGAGDRHVFSNGEQATINGATWQQITFGDDETTGWVSARFLAPDTPPDPNATAVPTPAVVPSGTVSVVCFQTQTDPANIARIVFTDRTEISGFVEADTGNGPLRRTVEGSLADGQAQLRVTDPTTGEVVRQFWTFNPASVVVDNTTTMSVVRCSALGLN